MLHHFVVASHCLGLLPPNRAMREYALQQKNSIRRLPGEGSGHRPTEGNFMVFCQNILAIIRHSREAMRTLDRCNAHEKRLWPFLPSARCSASQITGASTRWRGDCRSLRNRFELPAHCGHHPEPHRARPWRYPAPLTQSSSALGRPECSALRLLAREGGGCCSLIIRRSRAERS